VAVDRDLLPRDRDDLLLLLYTQLFERTLYELGHELTHRPDWVRIPLTDLEDLLEGSPSRD
jgi:maltose alpha-D-glucosyltransferase/alpha-amylase